MKVYKIIMINAYILKKVNLNDYSKGYIKLYDICRFIILENLYIDSNKHAIMCFLLMIL